MHMISFVVETASLNTTHTLFSKSILKKNKTKRKEEKLAMLEAKRVERER